MEGEEIIDREAKKFGGSVHATALKDWRGAEVKIIRVSDNLDRLKRASASWRTFIRFLEYKCDREGTHFVTVEFEGTTKEGAACEAEIEKDSWVRDRSCPTCGFETDRDENAAYKGSNRGLSELGVGHTEVAPAETALPPSTSNGSSAVVDAKCVVETGSPTQQERTATAVSE